MNDSRAPFAQARWLLLIHQLPPKPDYLRVKMRRRLSRMGAALLKSTVYVLPNGAEALEDFTWLAREIHAAGGSAMVCEARFVEGVSDEEIEAMLHAESIESSAAGDQERPERVGPGRTWVTRQGVFVDRIASAWLIRRFIDRAARLKFVPPKGYLPAAGEQRFDMFEAEHTHEGDRCTFEVLARRFGVADTAVAAIGEVVHDIDVRDGKFDRPETAGVERLITGIALTQPSDETRIALGSQLFDALYEAWRRKS